MKISEFDVMKQLENINTVKEALDELARLEYAISETRKDIRDGALRKCKQHGCSNWFMAIPGIEQEYCEDCV